MAKTDTPPYGLSETLRYDPETGLFHWLIATHGFGGPIAVGDVAGALKDGYVNLYIGKVLYRAHRVAWYMMTGEWLPSSQDIDHINRVRSDNRWVNLRKATRSLNCHNKDRNYGGRSGVNGVHFSRQSQKWEARISLNRTLRILGQFDEFADAVAARRAAELRYLGRVEIPDGMVPTAPLVEPTRRARTGLTTEGKARRLESSRKPRNAEGRHPGVRMNANRDKWVAMIRAEGRTVYLGTYPTYEDAVTARKEAETRHRS